MLSFAVILLGINMSWRVDFIKVGEEDGFHLASTAPPLPSPKWKSSSIRNSIPASSEKVTLDNGGGSSESFSSLKDESNWESANGHDDNEVAACVAVLDRAIAWAKARSAKLATQPSRPAKGVVAPIGSPIAGGPEDQGNLIKFENLTGAVTVIDKTMSAVKRRPNI